MATLVTVLAVTSAVTAVAGAGVGIWQGVEAQKKSNEASAEMTNAARNEELTRLRALNQMIGSNRVGVAVSGISQLSGSVVKQEEDARRRATIAQGESDIAASSRIRRIKARGQRDMASGIIGGVTSLSRGAKEHFTLMS